MVYGQPILQLYTSDPTIPGSKPTAYAITDDNRSPLQVTYERLEESSRMADGTMRRFITANKKIISTSWDTVPTAGGKNYTSDGYLSGAFLKSFFEENVYNPIWIKLTYSEEAWRLAGSQSVSNATKQPNLSYNRTVDNTAISSEFTIDSIGTSAISSSVGSGFIVTKTPHNIVPGSEIYIKGVNQIFNGTWIANSEFSSGSISELYNLSVSNAAPSLYLKFNTIPIVDSSTSSAYLNAEGRITSAGDIATGTGFLGNTASSSNTSYTSVTSSALASMETSFGVEFWIKGDSSPSTKGITIIRKLPFNLVTNFDFESDTSGWSAKNNYTAALGTVTLDTGLKRTGKASMAVTNIAKKTGASTAAASITYSNSMVVTAGLPYTLSGYIYPRNSLTPTPSARYWARIIWKNSSNAIISASTGASSTFTTFNSGWTKLTASGIAPVGAAYADISFHQSASSSSTMDVIVNLDQVLFEQSSTVNEFAGWEVTREVNNQVKFGVYTSSGTNAYITMPPIYDGQWHHVAFNARIDSSGSIITYGYLDGEYIRTGFGRASSFSNSLPVLINHSVTSGLKDELMLYAGKMVSNNNIISHYTNAKYVYEDPGDDNIITFNFGGLNSYLDFNINSYVYNNGSATFNVDSTDLLNVGAVLSISNYNPYTGSSVFTSSVSILSIDSETTFTASGPSIPADGAGNGFYGTATIISCDPFVKSLSQYQLPKVGTAVASDVLKVFITNFDYTISRRYALTDFVNMSIEFTEI